MATQIMGILNVTPDSFSDGGLHLEPDAAIARGLTMFDEGAAIVDVGGESTRPGARPTPLDDEIARVCPVVEALASHGAVSIDTRKPEVARAAISCGASIINDVSARLAHIAAETGSGWIVMHMQGDPLTMQTDPRYADVVAEVREFLCNHAKTARGLGVADIWVDPGIGFGKTVNHNLELLRNLRSFQTEYARGVVVGVSRKSFIGSILGLPDPHARLAGALAVSVNAIEQNVAILRTHDVAETVRAACMTEALQRLSDPNLPG